MIDELEIPMIIAIADFPTNALGTRRLFPIALEAISKRMHALHVETYGELPRSAGLANVLLFRSH